jgi:hypothetical protein
VARWGIGGGAVITLSTLGLIAIIGVTLIGGIALAWHVHASYMAMNERDRRFVRGCEVADEAENGECR